MLNRDTKRTTGEIGRLDLKQFKRLKGVGWLWLVGWKVYGQYGDCEAGYEKDTCMGEFAECMRESALEYYCMALTLAFEPIPRRNGLPVRRCLKQP